MKAPSIQLRSKLASKTYGSMAKQIGIGEGVYPSLGEIIPYKWGIDGFQSGITIEQIDNVMNLVWIDGSSNEDSILIERSLDGTNFVGINVVSPNTTSYSDDVTGIESEIIYYRITAIKGHKYNRSEVRQGILLKYRLVDSEGFYLMDSEGNYLIVNF